MKIVFFSRDAQFQLTDDEFKAFIEKANNEPNKKIYIPRLNVFLSDMFIWAGDRPESNDKMKLHDGVIAIRKYGQWVDEYSGARLDPNYYPEIVKDIIPEEDKNNIRIENKCI